MKKDKNETASAGSADQKKIDLQAAHRKAIMVMIVIFVAIMALMIFLQDHVEFASTGGM